MFIRVHQLLKVERYFVRLYQKSIILTKFKPPRVIFLKNFWLKLKIKVDWKYIMKPIQRKVFIHRVQIQRLCSIILITDLDRAENWRKKITKPSPFGEKKNMHILACTCSSYLSIMMDLSPFQGIILVGASAASAILASRWTFIPRPCTLRIVNKIKGENITNTVQNLMVIRYNNIYLILKIKLKILRLRILVVKGEEFSL